MLGQLVASTGLVKSAIGLDAIEASLVYLFSIIFLLYGVIGLAANNTLTVNVQTLANATVTALEQIPYDPWSPPVTASEYHQAFQIVPPMIDNYFSYFWYIIAGNSAALLSIALSYSVGASTAALELKPDPIPVRRPPPNKRSRASIQAQASH